MLIKTSTNDIKERLSIAYVTAITARAGCQLAKCDIDKQSVDLTVRPIAGPKISIDLQLKATSTDCYQGDQVSFDLPVKNYDDLRNIRSTAPHYLVVLVLHSQEPEWLVNCEQGLLIKHCAYWLDLRGKPSTINTGTINVKLPRTQVFDVAALQDMMRSAYDSTHSPLGGGLIL